MLTQINIEDKQMKHTEAEDGDKTHRRLSQEEIKLLIDTWKVSKLSQSAFCRREKINYQTFYYWVKRYEGKRKTKHKSAMSFIPLQPTKSHQSNELHSIEIKLPNGVQCRFSMSTDIKQIAQLTKELVNVIND